MRSHLPRGALAVALLAAFSQTPAFAHAVCGDRIFPATLLIDDPGVGDELALPTVTVEPRTPNSVGGQVLTTATASWTKTIFPGFGLSVEGGPGWLTTNNNTGATGGFGYVPLVTEAKWNPFCWPEHEFMASVGLQETWGWSGTGVMQQPFNTYTPILDVGKGFGDLPKSLNILRPFALTLAFSESVPTPTWAEGLENPTLADWGFTVQYSLPFYNEHVAEIDNPFFKRLVPIVEGNFQRPIANTPPGVYSGWTGTIQPGVVYEADTWQFALEAILPVNSQTGTGYGFVGELHFFLDDIFPNSLGKPLFGGKS